MPNNKSDLYFIISALGLLLISLTSSLAYDGLVYDTRVFVCKVRKLKEGLNFIKFSPFDEIFFKCLLSTY